MSTLSRVAKRNAYVGSCLRLIKLEKHPQSIFEWTEGRVEGYLTALNDLGHIDDDDLFMARDELTGLRGQWRVIK